MPQLPIDLFDDAAAALERATGLLPGDWRDIVIGAQLPPAVVQAIDFNGAKRPFVQRLVQQLDHADLGHLLSRLSVGEEQRHDIAVIVYRILASREENRRKAAGGLAEFDLFVSYCEEDEALVQRLCSALRSAGGRVRAAPWTRGGAGEPGGRLELLVASESVAICVGPGGLGPWALGQAGEILARQYHSRGTVIPIALPGKSDIELPASLGANLWVQFTGVQDDDVVRMLSRGFQKASVAPRASTAREPENPAANGVARASAAIARALPDTTFFVGRGSLLGDDGCAHSNAGVSRRLLERLGFIGAGYRALLPGADDASTWYTIGGDRDLEQELREVLRASQSAIMPLAARVAQLVALSLSYRLQRGERRARPIVFTTNLDMVCERELLRAGASFVRIVQRVRRSLEGTSVDFCLQFVQIELLGGNVLVTDGGGIHRLAPSSDEQWDEIIDFMPRQFVSGEEVERLLLDWDNAFTRSRYRDRPAAEIGPALPLLYKYCGSEDVEDSCVFARADYIGLAQLVGQHRPVPAIVKAELAKGPCVFSGLSLVDPDFIVLFETLIRPLFREQYGIHRRPPVRVAPVRLPLGEEGVVHQPLEARMWDKVAVALRGLSIEVLHESPVTFLDSVIAEVTQLARTKDASASGAM